MTTDALGGTVLQMDAGAMSFSREELRHIWSWGVIHHLADTQRVLQENAPRCAFQRHEHCDGGITDHGETFALSAACLKASSS